MTQPNCRVCGQFIAESDLSNADSVECCDTHGFIKICGSCLELFEKYAGEDEKCIIHFVKDYQHILNPMFHARYACPNGDYISFSFTKTGNHMFRKKHFYEGIGTYPIFIAPTLEPNLIPHNSDALKKLALQSMGEIQEVEI